MKTLAQASLDSAPADLIDYKSIALLSAAHLTDDLNQGVVPAMLPFFIAANHLTYAAAAGLILAQTLSSSVVQPLFGLLADRRPSPWLIPVGLSFAGIGVALAGLAPSYSLIFAAIALSGLGISAFHPEAARRWVVSRSWWKSEKASRSGELSHNSRPLGGGCRRMTPWKAITGVSGKGKARSRS